VPAIGRPLAHELVNAAELEPGERVLDVACGTGVVARLAAERVGPAGAVTGVDLNPGMLGVARSIAADGAEIEWHEADAAATGLPDGQYDAALCGLGLQFFGDRGGALRELRRVLRPGGRVAITVPGPTPPMFDILERALAEHVEPDAARFVAVVFSISDPAALERLLAEAGFESVAVRWMTKTLRLPPPVDFLWQYVASTPLAPTVAALDEQARVALARDVEEHWRPFAPSGGPMRLDVRVLTATGR
jgi:ubiquinone/menaquinone biosynthesis C-methylase UbiE